MQNREIHPLSPRSLLIHIAIFWLQDCMVKMEINSVRLDMKLVFEFTENTGSADINSSPDDNRTPKHGKVKCLSLLSEVDIFLCRENAVSLKFVDKLSQ